MEMYAGEKSCQVYGENVWLPDETLQAAKEFVDVLPEEINPRGHCYLGNYPQALTHAALIQAAHVPAHLIRVAGAVVETVRRRQHMPGGDHNPRAMGDREDLRRVLGIRERHHHRHHEVNQCHNLNTSSG